MYIEPFSLFGADVCFMTFSKLRPICRQSRWSTLKLMAPPYGKLTEAMLRFLSR